MPIITEKLYFHPTSLCLIVKYWSWGWQLANITITRSEQCYTLSTLVRRFTCFKVLHIFDLRLIGKEKYLYLLFVDDFDWHASIHTWIRVCHRYNSAELNIEFCRLCTFVIGRLELKSRLRLSPVQINNCIYF